MVFKRWRPLYLPSLNSADGYLLSHKLNWRVLRWIRVNGLLHLYLCSLESEKAAYGLGVQCQLRKKKMFFWYCNYFWRRDVHYMNLWILWRQFWYIWTFRSITTLNVRTETWQQFSPSWKYSLVPGSCSTIQFSMDGKEVLLRGERRYRWYLSVNL